MTRVSSNIFRGGEGGVLLANSLRIILLETSGVDSLAMSKWDKDSVATVGDGALASDSSLSL